MRGEIFSEVLTIVIIAYNLHQLADIRMYKLLLMVFLISHTSILYSIEIINNPAL